MSALSVDGILDKLGQELDKERYMHTLGVAYTASCMAMSLGMDKDKAYLAGLLHDCAKRVKTSGQIELARELGVELTDEDMNSPGIIHAMNGVVIAREEYGIEDKDILSAIRFHTTGKPDMSHLEKIIFIADYIEPHRDKQPRLAEIRQAAFNDIDKALVMIMKDTIDYLKDKNSASIHSLTEDSYIYYSKEKS